MRGICTKIGAISQLGTEKITFLPKPDGQTYRHTVRQTDGRTFAFIDSFAAKKGNINLWMVKESVRYLVIIVNKHHDSF